MILPNAESLIDSFKLQNTSRLNVFPFKWMSEPIAWGLGNTLPLRPCRWGRLRLFRIATRRIVSLRIRISIQSTRTVDQTNQYHKHRRKRNPKQMISLGLIWGRMGSPSNTFCSEKPTN